MILQELSDGTDLLLIFSMPSKTITVPYATIAGVITDYSSQAMLDSVRNYVYSQLDERRKKNSLPQDDPARHADPGLEGHFWDGGGGNPDIVTRPLIVTVTWDGSRFQYAFREPDIL